MQILENNIFIEGLCIENIFIEGIFDDDGIIVVGASFNSDFNADFDI